MADLRLQGCSAARIHKSQRMAAPFPQYAGAVKKNDGVPFRWLNDQTADASSFIDREPIDTAALPVFLSFPRKRCRVEKSHSDVRRLHGRGEISRLSVFIEHRTIFPDTDSQLRSR